MPRPAADLLRKASEFYDCFDSPLGVIYLVFHEQNLTEIRFERPATRKGSAPEGVIRELREYFDGERRDFSECHAFTCGTDFERSVWLALRDIPYGETRSYKWIAERVGRPRGSRAVGQALSKNPLPIVLPCHRVIESGGSLGGYAPGAEIKRRLLAMEYYQKGGAGS